MGFVKSIKQMSDFKTRLVSEQAELEEKLTKLNDFNQLIWQNFKFLIFIYKENTNGIEKTYSNNNKRIS